MPTGYTCIIEDGEGCTFAEYVWRCARAFGANILMRDDDMDKPIQKYTPSDYHTKALAEAEAKLAQLKAMTVEAAENKARREYEKAIESFSESAERERGTRERYRRMRSEVTDWIPPTDEHRGLKKFMLEQIDMCMRDSDYYTDDRKPVLQTGREWLAEEIAEASRNIAYHKREQAKEVERTNKRNEWNEQLAKSVMPPATKRGG